MEVIKMKEQELYFDWRIYGAATITEDVPASYPGGPSHKKGTPIYPTMMTRNPNGELISFITPSVPALALDLAIKAAKEAAKQQKRISFREGISFAGTNHNVTNENIPILYDFFESLMVSVTFSIQAIDIFCNVTIAHNLKGTLAIKDKKKTKNRNSQQLQDNYGTERKLNEFLPKIFKIQSPKDSDISIWNNFLELKRIRNSIIHMKSEDVYEYKGIDNETLFFEFFRTDPMIFPKYALEVISYFSDKIHNPKWIESAISYTDHKGI